MTIPGTQNARLKVTLKAEFDVVWELYSLTGTDCATRQLRDYYPLSAKGGTATVHSPCLVPGAYYVRIYPHGPVACTDYDQYRMVVELEQFQCGPCALTCLGGLDDQCPDDPNDPETNDTCNDPNHPGTPMIYPIGQYPSYGPKQCGRLATFYDPDDTPRADRDFFQFTMPAVSATLYVRAKAEFRLTIRLFDTQCQPIVDVNGVQRSANWDQACSSTVQQFISGLTPGMTYWAEVVYGNAMPGKLLREWFEGLPCSAGANTYEIELASGA